jgi:tRNA(adenine34) deaminase
MSPYYPDSDDEKYMRHALALARRAEEEGEVPIGALLVFNGEVIGEGWNRPITTCDPTAHAEILALRAAAGKLGNYRLAGSTLYVTLEPCPMCAGAMVLARVARVVYGAEDPRAGAAGSAFNLLQTDVLNHRTQVTGGIAKEQCAELLNLFFKQRRP